MKNNAYKVLRNFEKNTSKDVLVSCHKIFWSSIFSHLQANFDRWGDFLAFFNFQVPFGQMFDRSVRIIGDKVKKPEILLSQKLDVGKI